MTAPTPTEIPWTLFWDMHSGGRTKEGGFDKIYIQAPQEEAKVIFYNRFGHNPERVSCTCCGEDYSIDESTTLAQASGYHRNCDDGYFLKGTDVEVDARKHSDLTYDHAQKSRTFEGQPVEFRYVERQSTRYDEYCRSPIELAESRRRHRYMTIEEYSAQPSVLVIPHSEIKPEERRGSVPQSGYVWVD